MARSTSSKKSDVERGAHQDDIMPGGDEASINVWPNADDADIERAMSQEDRRPHGTSKPERRCEKATSVRSSALKRTLTGRSAASWTDPGPPPDGGRVAWTQAVLLHLTTFNTFGYTTAFGVSLLLIQVLRRRC